MVSTFTFKMVNVLSIFGDDGEPIRLDISSRLPPARKYPGYTVCRCCPKGVLSRALAAAKPPPSRGDKELPIAIDSDSDDSFDIGEVQWTSEHEHVAAQFDEHAATINL